MAVTAAAAAAAASVATKKKLCLVFYSARSERGSGVGSGKVGVLRPYHKPLPNVIDYQ